MHEPAPLSWVFPIIEVLVWDLTSCSCLRDLSFIIFSMSHVWRNFQGLESCSPTLPLHCEVPIPSISRCFPGFSNLGWSDKSSHPLGRTLQLIPLGSGLHYAYVKLCYVHLHLRINALLTEEVTLWSGQSNMAAKVVPFSKVYQRRKRKNSRTKCQLNSPRCQFRWGSLASSTEKKNQLPTIMPR